MSQKKLPTYTKTRGHTLQRNVDSSRTLSYFKTYAHIGISSEHTTEALEATAMPHAILNPAMHLSQYIPWKAMVF